MTSSTKPIHDQINDCENFADLAIVKPKVRDYEDALMLLTEEANLNHLVAFEKIIDVNFFLLIKVRDIEILNQN